jgi:Holliday junction resolvase-like predicted endonuclease
MVGYMMEQADNRRDILDRFLVRNPEFEQLSARLATFNIFRALKIERAEIRHSNMLAWLLDPNESHGLDEVFLRRILSNVLFENRSDIEGVTASRIELMELRDIEVRRESGHIDILVISRAENLVVLIENKVDSGEGPKQLVGYVSRLKEEFPSYKIIPVLLTLDGHPSEDEEAANVGYIYYGYDKLLVVLAAILSQRKRQMPDAVAVFLEHYIETLRRLTMQDDELTRLCQEIYRKHGEAIDLIVDRGKVSKFMEVATRVVGGKGGCEILSSGPRIVWFIPESWAAVVPENAKLWPHLTRRVSVCCWIEQWQDKVNLIFEICEMDDQDLRLACAIALKEGGFKFGTSKAFNKEARYSRFFRASQHVSDWKNEEEIDNAVNDVFGRAYKEFPKAEAVLKHLFSPKS